MKPQSASQLHWKSGERRLQVLLVMVAVWVAIIAIFGETAAAMVDIWTRSATFGHGYLIPLVTLGLIWMRRERVMAIPPRSSVLGLVGLAICSVLWFIAHQTGIAVGEQLAFVLMLQISVVAVLGMRIAAAIAFPLFYLVFMVPVGESLIRPMQEFTAAFVIRGLRLIDIPVYADGFFIHLPNGSFEVAEACAGLNYLIAMVALGALFANLFFRQWWRRILFMIIAITVPIFMNGLRALGIVLLAYFSDNRIAVGVDHILYGWVFLSMTTMAVLAFGIWIRERKEKQPAPNIPHPAFPAVQGGISWPTMISAAVAAVFLAGIGPAFSTWQSGNMREATVARLELPVNIGGWTKAPPTDPSWKPEFRGAHQWERATYRQQGQSVDLYVAYYVDQHQGAEAVNAANSLEREGSWSRIGTYHFEADREAGWSDVVGTTLTSPSGDRRLAVTLYWVAGHLTASPIEAKLFQTLGILKGRPEAAALVLSTSYSDRPDEAVGALSRFMSKLDVLRQALAEASTP